MLVEFFRGAKSISDMSKKVDYIESIVGDVILPTGEHSSESGAVNLIEPHFLVAYGRAGKSVSYTDYLLAKTIKHYKERAYLMTGNHSDFPVSIFDRKHIVSIGYEDKVKTFGVFSFDQSKYDSKLKNLLSQEQ